MCPIFVGSFHNFCRSVGRWHDIVKKCLFPIDAYMVWCPTWSKNLGRYLIQTLITLNSRKQGDSFYRIISHQNLENAGLSLITEFCLLTNVQNFLLQLEIFGPKPCTSPKLFTPTKGPIIKKWNIIQFAIKNCSLAGNDKKYCFHKKV